MHNFLSARTFNKRSQHKTPEKAAVAENGNVVQARTHDGKEDYTMKKTFALLLTLSMLMTLGWMSTAQAAEIPTKVTTPLYTVEPSTFHSTMNTITGGLPKFSGISDANFAAKLDGIVSSFYTKVMDTAKPVDGRYPSVSFTYETYESGAYLSLVMHGSVSFGNTGSDIVGTIVLDQRSYKLYALKDLLGDDAYNTAWTYLLNEVKQNSEKYQLTAGTYPTVDESTAFYMSTDGALVFIYDKYELAPGVGGTPRFVYPLGSETRSIVGTVVDATMNTVSIKTSDGRKLSFATDKANRSHMGGLTIGKQITVTYTGTVQGSDTSLAQVTKIAGYYPLITSCVIGKLVETGTNSLTIRTSGGTKLTFATEMGSATPVKDWSAGTEVMVSYSGTISGSDASGATVVKVEKHTLLGQLSVSGTIVDATMNTLTIKTSDGRTLSFSTVDADTTQARGLSIDKNVTVVFTGYIIGSDTTNTRVLSVSDRVSNAN